MNSLFQWRFDLSFQTKYLEEQCRQARDLGNTAAGLCDPSDPRESQKAFVLREHANQLENLTSTLSTMSDVASKSGRHVIFFHYLTLCLLITTIVISKMFFYQLLRTKCMFNPLSTDYALKHHFTSLRTDLIFLQLGVF